MTGRIKCKKEINFRVLFSYYINTGHLKTLNQFTYNDRDINDIILSCMSNVSMTGITGNIAFGEGSDPIKNVKIERIQGNCMRMRGSRGGDRA